MECPAVMEKRIKFIPKSFREVKSTYNFCRLMSSKKRKVALKLAKFLIETKTVYFFCKYEVFHFCMRVVYVMFALNSCVHFYRILLRK